MADPDANEIDVWLDQLDVNPSDFGDATHMRRIAAAAHALADAQAELLDAVKGARAAGDSWSVIGVGLGVSRQEAQRRYGSGPSSPTTGL